jgi:hypothetical protein
LQPSTSRASPTWISGLSFPAKAPQPDNIKSDKTNKTFLIIPPNENLSFFTA